MKPKSYGGHPLNLIISGSIYDSFIITSSKMFFNGPFPASFSVCSSFQNSWQYWLNTNFLQWLDSNHGPLESEAIALPSEPQPLPQVWLLVGSPRLVTKKSVARCTVLVVSATFKHNSQPNPQLAFTQQSFPMRCFLNLTFLQYDNITNLGYSVLWPIRALKNNIA